MKLQSLVDTSRNALTGYGPGFLEVNRARYSHPLLVMPARPVQAWPVPDVSALDAAAFESLLALEPELVLLGTGERQRFVHPRLYAALSGRRIGVEMMDTGAACRTYNILMSEGRQVLAALFAPAAG